MLLESRLLGGWRSCIVSELLQLYLGSWLTLELLALVFCLGFSLLLSEDLCLNGAPLFLQLHFLLFTVN